MTDSVKAGIVLLLIPIIATILGFNWGIAHKGIVDSSDCRIQVKLKEKDWATYWHPFYCSSSAFCQSVSLTNDGKCTVGYSFFKNPGSMTLEQLEYRTAEENAWNN